MSLSPQEIDCRLRGLLRDSVLASRNRRLPRSDIHSLHIFPIPRVNFNNMVKRSLLHIPHKRAWKHHGAIVSVDSHPPHTSTRNPGRRLLLRVPVIK